MPALSPTMEAGTLAKWLKSEGDQIASGDVIAEIETDKATMEVEAVEEGTLARILVAEGTEDVAVNAPIAILLEENEDLDTLEDFDANAGSSGSRNGDDKASAPAEAPSPENVPAEDASSEEASKAPPSSGQQSYAKPAETNAPKRETVIKDGRIKASPLARRMASQQGLDLAGIEGSGPHGRIVKRDIERAAQAGSAKEVPERAAQAAAASAPQSSSPAASDIDPRKIYPAGSYDEVPADGMRKVIARRLTQSFAEVPHFPLNIDCEIDRLLALRSELNEKSPEGDGAYKISVNDFVIKASALALTQVPEANASWAGDAILRHKHADIGVAVAIDGGLITPIVWRAETKGLSTISAEVKELAGRARERKLQPAEYQGGTFSVSNLGMFGIASFASVINQPQGAIMSVGAGIERPVVRGGALAIATVMTVTLTCDHRAVDGAVGAQFLRAFKDLIEDPVRMLL